MFKLQIVTVMKLNEFFLSFTINELTAYPNRIVVIEEKNQHN